MERIESNSLTNHYRLVPLDVQRRKRKSDHFFHMPVSLKIPWLTILIGFFLSRALLLDELLPFGIAFLAAIQKNPKLRSVWALFGVLAGYISLAPLSVVYPYFISTILIWIAGAWKKKRISDGYWVCGILMCLLAVKAPLTMIRSNYPMTWIIALSEAIVALASYSIFSSLVDRNRVYALSSGEFQLGLLLSAILLGVDISISGLSLRVVLIFYLMLSLARLGGISLSLKAGPIFAIITILLRLPIELAALIVVVSVFSGLLNKFPLGFFIAGFSAYLLTFGVPVIHQTVHYLLMLLIAGLLVYLTPAQNLRRLERLIPGTRKYKEKQESHSIRVQKILENRVNEFAKIFQELGDTLGDNVFTAYQLKNLAQIVEVLGTEFSTHVEFAEAVEYQLWQRLDNVDLVELTVLHINNEYNITGRCKNFCGENFCHQVAEECQHLLGGLFSVVQRDCLVNAQCGFDIFTKPRYRLDVKIAKLAQGKVSGDSNSVFKLGVSKLALLISDGMGTGERAASDSQATIHLLERMIKTGYDPELAVKIINQTLMARSTTETFATIDLVVVDLHNGLLEFIKIGATASFIKRRRDIEVVQNYSLPIGILNHVDIEPEKRLLREGEYLIMVTDGVLEFQRDVTNKDEWMCSVLRHCEDALSCQELADLLLIRSVEAADGHISDDMMVLVARLIREDDEIYPYQRK